MLELGLERSEGPRDIFVDMNKITEEEGVWIINRLLSLSQKHEINFTHANRELFDNGGIFQFDDYGRINSVNYPNRILKYEYNDDGNLIMHSDNNGDTLTVETYSYRTDSYGLKQPTEITVQQFKSKSMLVLTQRKVYNIGPIQNHENY